MMNGDTNHHTTAPPASASPQKYKTLLMDMDGVLAEVSMSYRAAIERTCHAYGAKSVTQETITQWKIRGNANDDWKLSHALILDDPDGRNDVTLQQVTETFERFYQGDDDAASDTDGAAATTQQPKDSTRSKRLFLPERRCKSCANDPNPGSAL